MGSLVRLSEVDLQATADRTLGHVLHGTGIRRILARAGEDHDGDPAVLMVVAMPPGSTIAPPRLLAAARVALSKALERHGDERLIHLSVDGPEDEAPPITDVPT